MTSPTLFTLISGFFVPHLSAERNVSGHTAAAYRDAVKLLLQFVASTRGGTVDQLHIEDLTSEAVLAFLTHLETTRHNTVRTRNARLAAIHSFFRYVLAREPALAAFCQRVLSIPVKKALRPVLGYFQESELGHLLAQIDRTHTEGERDYLLVALLYDTGARIQELLDLTPRDCRFDTPPFVRLRGKGRRERLCPLLPQTARLITRFLATENRSPDDHAPLLHRRHGGRLTRHGARYLLAKYLDRARSSMPGLNRPGLSLHTLRHYEGDAPAAIRRAARHDQGFPRTRRPEVDRGLRPARPGNETARAGSGRHSLSRWASASPTAATPDRLARINLTEVMRGRAPVIAENPGQPRGSRAYST